VTERSAIVTGGGSGIGLAISERLAADGIAVGVLDLNGDAADEAAAKITAAGGTAIGLEADVTDRPSIDAAVAAITEAHGAPTILVNNAGLDGFSPFLDITLEQWNRIFEVNLTGTFHCCQAVVPAMLEAGWGRIVNISSSSAQTGSAKMAHYVASKGGVIGLTKALAMEYVAKGITVNHVPPGFIDTPLTRQTLGDVQAVAAMMPMKRAGTPEDVAHAVAFLASEEAGYVTGQTLSPNGGRYLV